MITGDVFAQHNRSNLMQVAQILKMIALMKWEEISDERLHDLYSRLELVLVLV